MYFENSIMMSFSLRIRRVIVEYSSTVAISDEIPKDISGGMAVQFFHMEFYLHRQSVNNLLAQLKNEINIMVHQG